ncbi:MAG: XRE family transcriptional regulator [Oleiphilaceae bacterium]|nr:XRE family transcriptional regulator [Oleiphilaceae bacterium]
MSEDQPPQGKREKTKSDQRPSGKTDQKSASSAQSKQASESKPDNKPGSHKKPDRQTSTSSASKQSETRKKEDKPEPWVSEEALTSFFGRITDVTSSAFRFAKKTTDTSYKVGKAIIQSQDQLKLMVAAGQSLKDLREVAGLTVAELSEAINLKDKSLLEAVENGTATLSFELILRLSALLARNDPIPFILKYSRTYSPETWKLLNDWGAGRLPLQYQREREFINIYRSQDAARQLSDEGFAKVLEFTRHAFNLSLHFISEQEGAIKDFQTDFLAQQASHASAQTPTEPGTDSPLPDKNEKD